MISAGSVVQGAALSHSPFVHLWLVDTGSRDCDQLLDRYSDTLHADEWLRLNRLKLARHKRSYTLTRILCRMVLSGYYPDISPKHWFFSRSEFGKPSIGNSIGGPLYFNLSHSGDRIALGITNIGELGVDIEQIHRSRDYCAIVDNHFSEREQFWVYATDEPERRRRFFKLWSLKEAYTKALGEGLRIPLNGFSISPLPEPRIEKTWDQDRCSGVENWSFVSYSMENYELALSLPVDIPASLCRVMAFSSASIQMA